MTDTTEKLSTELTGDLDAPQPTSAEADLVRGGMLVAAVVARNIANQHAGQGGQNDPAQMFQQILQQLAHGE